MVLQTSVDACKSRVWLRPCRRRRRATWRAEQKFARMCSEAMEFSILGSVAVGDGGRSVSVGGLKVRGVLAVLLLHANEPVSADRLALALWGEDAPVNVIKTVQVHVSRLRKALGDRDVLVSTPAGYRLRVRHGELDADRFAELVLAGREALAEGWPERAADVLREALELWRGGPLDDLIALPFAPAEIAQLDEQRLAAVELRIEAELESGHDAALVGELRQLVTTHPWRERLHGLLMLALYRSGRQAEALEAYRDAREVLVQELGIEPGAELKTLHQAILEQEPDLSVPSPRATSAQAPARGR